MNEFKQLVDLIGKYVENAKKSVFYLSDKLSDVQKRNITVGIAPDVDSESIVGFFDTTILHDGKKGLLFTTASMYYKENKNIDKIRYCEIETVNALYDKSGINIANLKIVKRDGTNIIINNKFLDLSELSGLILELKKYSTANKVDVDDKYIVLEDLSECVKENYVFLIVNYTSLDNEFTGLKLSKIYLLCTRIKLSPSSRKKVLRYISSENKDKENILIEMMDSKLSIHMKKAVHVSLLKDILSINDTSYAELYTKQKEYINNLADIFELSNEQLRLIQQVLEIDKQFIDGTIDDKKYYNMMQKIASTASAIGIPIAAIYLSGSVVGLSAAGVTSGLAAMGLGGLLGLSSMVTGIGTVVVVAIAAYKSSKYIYDRITNSYKKTYENKREFLLQEVLRLNQQTISSLIEDVNIISTDLAEAIAYNEINKIRIEKIKDMLNLYISALKCSDSKNNITSTKFQLMLGESDENK